MKESRSKIIILDFGSQFTQLIARRIRELGVYSEIHPSNTAPSSIDSATAVILSGGPASVTDIDAPPFDEAWLSQGIPVLGVCYGMQLLGLLHGGRIEQGNAREYGHRRIVIQKESPLFTGIPLHEETTVWMSHGDHLASAPAGYEVLAVSVGGDTIAAIGNAAKNIYGLQFHSEVVHTERGKEIISNFLFNIAGCKADWSSESVIDQTIAKIRSTVEPDAQVICGLSGGVDSSVAAVIVNKALPGRLTCIFVDTGLLRANEGEEVMTLLSGLGLTIRKIDAGPRFLSALKGITDPEAKRKIIGHTFIEVFDEESKKISGVTHLVQGTLYPDVIESLSVRGPSATIKTHHNVGGLPERMALKLIEPFRECFKDEVRKIGETLGMPEQVIHRQPFPGPGLAVRILGEVTPERVTTLQKADAIWNEEVVREGWYRKLWQSFAVLLPIKSVGVMGDGRTYEESVALRAVTSVDGMTADWAYLPHELLRRTSSRIINEVRGINRVVLDISSKPPATIEWE